MRPIRGMWRSLTMKWVVLFGFINGVFCLPTQYPQSTSTGILQTAQPQIPEPDAPGPGCRQEYKIITEMVLVPQIQRMCSPQYKPVCNKQKSRSCEPVTEQQCHTEKRRTCQTKWHTVCPEVPGPSMEEQCQDRVVKVCQKHWVETDYNVKEWQDDAASCVELNKTECQPLPQTDTTAPCEQQPRQECTTTDQQICQPVVRQHCTDLELPEPCQLQLMTGCQEQLQHTPKQVSKRIAVTLCQETHTTTHLPMADSTERSTDDGVASQEPQVSTKEPQLDTDRVQFGNM